MKREVFLGTLGLLCLGATAEAQNKPPPPLPAAPAATATPTPAVPQPDQTPIIDFPGQYAPRPAGEKFPVFAKGCARLEAVIERVACTDFVLADWPRLSRFAAANAALAPAKAGERRAVFFGDSITDNWSKKGYGGFFPGRPYLNRGIGGQTTGQMLVRLRADVIALKPAVVVILAGTNDVSGNSGPATPESIQYNLASIADLARAAGIRVVMASILPVTDAKVGSNGSPIIRTRDRPPETMRVLNRWMAGFAQRKGHVFLDYSSALVDGSGSLKPELTDDGLHPNAAGYAIMAPLAERAIARALGRSTSATKPATQAAVAAP